MKLLSQKQLYRSSRMSKTTRLHICMIKAWSHIFALFSRNENPPVVSDEVSDENFFSDYCCHPIRQRDDGGEEGTLLSESAGSLYILGGEALFETMADSDSEDITDLVHQFMAVTGAEDTVALSYLQQSSWNVEVCGFFAKISASPFSKSPKLIFVQFLVVSVCDQYVF